jgi:hypothetical protein
VHLSRVNLARAARSTWLRRRRSQIWRAPFAHDEETIDDDKDVRQGQQLHRQLAKCMPCAPPADRLVYVWRRATHLGDRKSAWIIGSGSGLSGRPAIRASDYLAFSGRSPAAGCARVSIDPVVGRALWPVGTYRPHSYSDSNTTPRTYAVPFSGSRKAPCAARKYLHAQ